MRLTFNLYIGSVKSYMKSREVYYETIKQIRQLLEYFVDFDGGFGWL